MNEFEEMCENLNKAIELGFDISNAKGLDEIKEKCNIN